MTQYNGINRRGASVDKASLSLSPCVCLGFCPPPAPLPLVTPWGFLYSPEMAMYNFCEIM